MRRLTVSMAVLAVALTAWLLLGPDLRPAPLPAPPADAAGATADPAVATGDQTNGATEQPHRGAATQALDAPGAARARSVHVVDTAGKDVPNAELTFCVGTELLPRVADANGWAQAPAGPLTDLVVSAKGRATCRLVAADLGGADDIVVRLPDAARLQVEVVDDGGHRVCGLLVEAVVEHALTADNRTLLQRTAGWTDQTGTVTFDNLGTAQYWIIVYEWRRWRGTDHYEVKPLTGQTTLLQAKVFARPASECLEVLVAGIEPGSWRQGTHPELLVEIEDRSGLEHIYPPGEATVIGDPGGIVRVRLISIAAHDATTALTEWRSGIIGQSRPIELSVPETPPARK